MKTQWAAVAGWYYGVMLAALPWVAAWRPWMAPIFAVAALAAHRTVNRTRSAVPWSLGIVVLSVLGFIALRPGWEVALGWSLLAAMVGLVARARPRDDHSRPDAADLLAVGGWGVVFVLAPRLIELDQGGWLAPALLLYVVQRLARREARPVETTRPGPPGREVRGTLSLNQVVVAGSDRLPRSVPLDLELRAGDSVAILCDSSADAAVLADVFAGRLKPRSGEISFDGSPLRSGEILVAVVAPGEDFIDGDLRSNVAILCDGPLDGGSYAALSEACSLNEVSEALGSQLIEIDGSPLSAFHRMLVLTARVIPSPFRLVVVVDPMPWVNAVRGELWRSAVVRASVGRTSVWLTPDRGLAERASMVLEFRQGALRRASGSAN